MVRSASCDAASPPAIRNSLEQQSGRINGAYADTDWVPIRYVNKGYPREVLAGIYRAARIGLVTPLRDGMNLVAKEYVAAQDPRDPGVLILSRFAGAADEFRDALLVNPYDPDAVAAAIARAAAMPLSERKARHAELYAALLRSDISGWGDKFLKALDRPDRQGGLRDFIPPATESERPATRQ